MKHDKPALVTASKNGRTPLENIIAGMDAPERASIDFAVEYHFDGAAGPEAKTFENGQKGN